MRIEPLLGAQQIQDRVRELAGEIARDYGSAALVIVCIALGAVRFVNDLCARLAERGLAPDRIDIRARRTQGTALGPVEIDHFEPDLLENRHVLVIDDVADEGATLRAVHEIVALGEPRSVRTAVLIDKRERRSEPLLLHYVGFVVERGWVIGYGMDVDGDYRALDWIGVLVDDRF